MLISDYLSSNLKISILFLIDPFNGARAEMQNIFGRFLVQMKTSKFVFEIN
jgi:hypothetical protein